jgi:ADP-ribose pyrophosphatase
MVPHGPWQIVRSREVYKDAWMEVRSDEVIRPDGRPGTHGLVVIRPGVSVLPLDDLGYVYLTEEFHYAVGRTTLEVVSGGIEEAEEPVAAAHRELAEELGITARELIPLGGFDPFTTMLNAPARLYLARELSFGQCAPDGTEQIRCVTMPLAQAVALAMEGVISHGPSCAVILKSHLWLQERTGPVSVVASPMGRQASRPWEGSSERS